MGTRPDTIKNLIGQRFNNYVVLSYVGRKGSNTIWLCQCDCGHKREISRTGLSVHVWQRGKNCWKCYLTSERVKFKHGMSATPIYSIWMKIKKNCVFVWRDFRKFYEDMGRYRTEEQKYLVRRNPSEPHSKQNSFWGEHTQGYYDLIDELTPFLVRDRAISREEASRQLVSVSRERMRQIKNYYRGLCKVCGKKRTNYAQLCDDCAVVARKRARKKKGTRDNRGRKPFIRPGE